MADQFRQFLNTFYVQSKGFYGGLTKGRKIAIGAGFVAILFMLSAVLFYSPKATYGLAYQDLSQDDKNAILAELKKQNVTDFKMEGDSIYFPEEKILEMKMLLAQENLPNSGTGPGWEKFDERSFALSDFEQNVNKLRALQGELARTIDKLDPVANSRVHIVLPPDSVFVADKQPPSASIYLKLRQGKTLSKRQIQGIVHLVSKAVQGLNDRDVSIVDSEGNLLTEPPDEVGGIDKVTAAQRDYQIKVEKGLEQKIKEILVRVVGQDKMVAKVEALVDFTKTEQTISDVDPERTAVIASQRNEQSTTGNGLNPTGVPGAKSNLPGAAQDTGAAGGLTNSSKSNSENTNYEVKKTISKIVDPIGRVEKLNVSVLVDWKSVDGKPVARTKEELAMISGLVKNAIGFNDKRDAITVESAQFEPDEFAIAARETVSARQFSLLQTLLISLVGIAAMFFIYYALVRPYFRWLTFDPEKRSKEQMGITEYEFEKMGSAAKRVQLQEEVPFDKLSPKEQILYLAKHDPRKTTEAIRQLLNPR